MAISSVPNRQAHKMFVQKLFSGGGFLSSTTLWFCGGRRAFSWKEAVMHLHRVNRLNPLDQSRLPHGTAVSPHVVSPAATATHTLTRRQHCSVAIFMLGGDVTSDVASLLRDSSVARASTGRPIDIFNVFSFSFVINSIQRSLSRVCKGESKVHVLRLSLQESSAMDDE
jgi:hypothetical protein